MGYIRCLYVSSAVVTAVLVVLSCVSVCTTATVEKRMVSFAQPQHNLTDAPFTDAGENTATPLPRASDSFIAGMLNNISQNALYDYIYRLQNFTTRYALHPNCLNASIYIYDKLSNYSGLEASYFPFVYQGKNMRNVIAILPGVNKSNGKIYVLGGHYDSTNQKQDPMLMAPGADDDASGTAGVMEAARIMSRYRFESTIVFGLWSAEELGLIGSSFYARHLYENNVDVGGMINLDMIGNDGPKTLGLNVGAYPDAVWLSDIMKNVNTDYKLSLNITTTGGGGSSDHAAFNAYGYPGIICIEKDFSPNYHSKDDTIDKLHMPLVRKTTQMCVGAFAQTAKILKPHEGKVFLDRPSYMLTDAAEITVYDSDASGAVTARIRSGTESVPETVTLSPVEPGVFRGTIIINPGPSKAGNGKLEVSHGDIITAEYTDASPAMTVYASSIADGKPPAIWGVSAKPGVTSAEVSWFTNEPANSTVAYGTSPPFAGKIQGNKLVEKHRLLIKGLQPDTVYYFDVAGTDLAGNSFTSDNGGSHYGFRTLTGIETVPGYGYAYWVRENSAKPGGHNPHFDGTLMVGWGEESKTFYGAVQFNITGFPSGATVTNATIGLYAQGWANPSGSYNAWKIKMLAPAIDAGFNTHTYPEIAAAAAEAVLPPCYPDDSLKSKSWNTFYFNNPTLMGFLGDHISSGKLSARVEGPTSGFAGMSHIYTWDAGHGSGSYGEYYGPKLTILYSVSGDTAGPLVSNMTFLPDTTEGRRFVNLSATITDSASDVVAAEYFLAPDPGFGKGIPVSSATGIFNSPIVNVRYQLDTSSLAYGDHRIYLRGCDSSGNWGAHVSEILHVTVAAVTENITIILPCIVIFACAATVASRKNTGRLR